MAAPTYKLARLAGDFPPGLNTSDPAWRLKEGETPDGYGYDLAYDGGIKTGTCPTGTARVQTVITITEGAINVPYFWHYNRLLNITNRTATTPSNVLTIGAEYYDDIFFPQGLGKRAFNEDAEVIKAIVPMQPDKLAVLKATGGYVLSNLSDSRGYFQRSDMIQELAVNPDITTPPAIELGGVVYVSFGDRLTAYKDAQAQEISRKIRGETIGGRDVFIDSKLNRVILGDGDPAGYCYDVEPQKWFKYVGSDFRFTTRQLIGTDWAPFSADRLIFVVQHLEQSDVAVLKYQTKYEDGAWSDDFTVRLPYEPGVFTSISESLERNLSVMRFQVRVTEMASTVVLREVWVNTNAKQRDDWSA